jgi:transketolase N-terminal domain/subunit
MSLLETISGPEDVQRLGREQLPQLAEEVRQRLIDVVSETGGHIGAGLGVVELTIALLYAFDSPKDKILWDVGHQGYPWKILTGRNDRLPSLRQEDGLSGFLRRVESEHDHFGAGHAGTAMSAALGMAAARDVKGETFHVVAVAGDGALTCGMPYEGMNNAGHSDRDIILVVNDNGMSIAPNVGAISKYFGSIDASPMTVKMRGIVKQIINRASKFVGGKRMVDFAKNVEESVKNLWSPGMLFEELGFRYFGPIDGHDLPGMVNTLNTMKTIKGPRVLHVLTEKGKGFPLEPDSERFHARNPYDPVTGVLKPSKPGAGDDHRGDAVGYRHQHLPEEVAREILRCGYCRGARHDVRGRARHARNAAHRRYLLNVLATRLRQHHSRRGHPEAARHLLHGSGRHGGRGRANPHGIVRHCVYALGAQHDGDPTERRGRVDRVVAVRAGAQGRPIQYAVPPG